MTNSNVFNILNSYYELLNTTGYLKFTETGCIFIFCDLVDMINDTQMNWLFDYSIEYLRELEPIFFELQNVSTLINIDTENFLDRPFM